MICAALLFTNVVREKKKVLLSPGLTTATVYYCTVHQLLPSSSCSECRTIWAESSASAEV